MSSREDAPDPGASAADTSQPAPAALQDNNRENSRCPECQHISTACSSSCRHCFCPLCLWDWSLGDAVCPRCQRPIRHPYPQRVALYHEVQDRVYDRKRRRSQSWSQNLGRSRPWERRRERSVRWPRDGRWQSQHAQGSDSPRRRFWWQQRRVWEDTPEEGRIPRLEWAIPVSPQGSRSRCRSRRSWSQQEQSQGHRRWSRSRERSRNWDRRQSRSSRRDQDTQPGSHDGSAGQRRWRNWNVDDRHAPRPQHDVPSERRETLPLEDPDSSRQRHTRRRRSRGRSHRRRLNSQGMMLHDPSANQRYWRIWNADDRQSPRPQHDTPLRRSERHQWQEQRTRSQRRGRSHRRGHNSHSASQGVVPPDNSTRQRQGRSWNADQERAPRFQQNFPCSSGRSQHQRRSRAGHRDS